MDPDTALQTSPIRHPDPLIAWLQRYRDTVDALRRAQDLSDLAWERYTHHLGIELEDAENAPRAEVAL